MSLAVKLEIILKITRPGFGKGVGALSASILLGRGNENGHNFPGR